MSHLAFIDPSFWNKHQKFCELTQSFISRLFCLAAVDLNSACCTRQAIAGKSVCPTRLSDLELYTTDHSYLSHSFNCDQFLVKEQWCVTMHHSMGLYTCKSKPDQDVLPTSCTKAVTSVFSDACSDHDMSTASTWKFSTSRMTIVMRDAYPRSKDILQSLPMEWKDNATSGSLNRLYTTIS